MKINAPGPRDVKRDLVVLSLELVQVPDVAEHDGLALVLVGEELELHQVRALLVGGTTLAGEGQQGGSSENYEHTHQRSPLGKGA
jgi:hypothetical protein